MKEDSEFVQGSSSVVIMKALKYAGLTDDTLKRIEEDLRSSNKQPSDEGEVSPANEAEEAAKQIEQDRKLT